MDKAVDIENLVYEWVVAGEKGMGKFGDFYCPSRDVFEGRLNRMLTNLLESKAVQENDAHILSAIVGEIGNNSFDHNLGNWPDVSGIFFGYDFTNNVKIILADRGQGILRTLKRVKPELENDQEALRVAFTEKISGRAPENRGNGLKFVKENIESRKMHLLFISGNAQIELNEEMKIIEVDEPISGCLAIINA